MMSTRVVSDNTCGLPQKVVRALGITLTLADEFVNVGLESRQGLQIQIEHVPGLIVSHPDVVA